MIHSEEDRMWMKKKSSIILCPSGDGHSDVSRIRSAHRKDLETVLPFIIFTPLWLNVETCNSTMRILIPGFALINILYTLVHMQLLQVSALWKHYSSMILYCILIYICAITTMRYTIIISKLI